MPDNLTASEVERINAAMRNAFPYFPETKWKQVPDFYRMCEMIAPHLPELLRAWEELEKLKAIGIERSIRFDTLMQTISRAETAEHEREVMRRALDAARAEVADLKRENGNPREIGPSTNHHPRTKDDYPIYFGMPLWYIADDSWDDKPRMATRACGVLAITSSDTKHWEDYKEGERWAINIRDEDGCETTVSDIDLFAVEENARNALKESLP